MNVVDASVLTEMLAFGGSRGGRAARVLERDLEWCAPEHWKAELFPAIRGLTLGGRSGQADARWIIEQIPRLTIDHVGVDGLLVTMWALRHEVRGYDAAYVVLAQQRGLTLVTADARLARTAVRHCRVEALH